ncbi:ABC transporter ATP-binding protein [Sulfobacillus harzensis]|uniref:ABC transporter ATP-binding protein n=1 Tax=Sulfobacillus harzensis TaxID=2729629 RepID=A0A7Y0Q408_9FIRM|nr:ABC transporter ATP-binding protein [Sulfobacillus harzensis]NMP24122.1 ABC transporter ATP-binding protein [Sulfobacillus harzensis]
MDNDTILECHDVVCTFGGVRAVNEASLSIERGTITGLIGPNGAGKSTLVNAISGHVRLDHGYVAFDGQPITRLRPHQVAERGLVRTFQLASEFPNMTVLENMMTAPHRQAGENFFSAVFSKGRWQREEERHLIEARTLLASFGLQAKEEEYAGNLSGGQKRLLELARALMTRPTMLLLDEPMAGVSGPLIDALADHILRLNRETGLTFLIIEHDLGFMEKVCDRVNVMVNGSVLTHGTMKELREDERVVEAYLS